MLHFKQENGKDYLHRLIKEFHHEIDPRLSAILLGLDNWTRVQLGKELTITCLNRTKEENKKVGGVAWSAHLDGRAADIRTWNLTDEDIGRIKRYLSESWGTDFLFFKYHDSGSGKHIHLNINYKHRRN